MSQFKGFPRELPVFFDALERHNNKAWFTEHKNDYEVQVKGPSADFVSAMGERLREIAPRIQAIPKVNQSLFRLNRDTRFSKDKRPYKTNMGIWLWEGARKRMECSGFYFHIEGKKLMLGTGIHTFTRALLGPYRDAVVDKRNGPGLAKAVRGVSGMGYGIHGSHYKRIPAGYDPNHENAPYLLHNGLAAMIEEDIPDVLYSEEIIDYAFSHFKNMAPIHQWLINALP